MSEVISFRLDSNNPREAEALAVLASHQERGYSARQIMTEALLKYAQGDESDDLQIQLAEILTAMQRVGEQVERIQKLSIPSTGPREERQAILSDAFKLSVKTAAKPGVTLEG